MSGCVPRLCRRNSFTRRATSPITTGSCRRSIGPIRCTRASSSFRTSTRSSARTTRWCTLSASPRSSTTSSRWRSSSAGPANSSGRMRRTTTSPATRFSTTSPLATSSAGNGVGRVLVLQGHRHLLPDRAVDRHQRRGAGHPRTGDGAARQREVRQVGNTDQTRIRSRTSSPTTRRRVTPPVTSSPPEPSREWPPFSRTRSTSTCSRRPHRGGDRGYRRAPQPGRAVESRPTTLRPTRPTFTPRRADLAAMNAMKRRCP